MRLRARPGGDLSVDEALGAAPADMTRRTGAVICGGNPAAAIGGGYRRRRSAAGIGGGYLVEEPAAPAAPGGAVRTAPRLHRAALAAAAADRDRTHPPGRPARRP